MSKRQVEDLPETKASPARQGRVARERKSAVLKAAVRVFLEKGFEATSVMDVIAEVGGSKASIYGHFHNKEGLFTAVMRQQIEALSGVLTDLEGRKSNIELALAEIGTQFLRLILDETSRALQTIVLHEARKFPELGRMFLTHGPKPIIKSLTDFIRRCHTNGDLFAPDPEMAAWQFVLLCQAKYAYPSMIAGTPSPSKKQCQQSIDAAIQTFMASYGTHRNDGALIKSSRTKPKPQK